MKSQSMMEYGEPLRDMTHDLPTPVGTQVLMAIKHCGVCHSDIHIHDGYFKLGGDKTTGRFDPVATCPFTLGHEIEGEVLAVGPDAAGIAVGDRRAVYPWMGCGSCEICQRGDEHFVLRNASPWHNGRWADMPPMYWSRTRAT